MDFTLGVSIQLVKNGEIPLSYMIEVAPNRYLAPGAARAWLKFARELGLTVGNAADSCYRTLAWQKYRYAHRPPAAAYPGTSNHGWGMAVDIGNYYRFKHATLVKVAKKYNFVFDTPSELWHIKYLGAPEYNTSSTAGGSVSLLESKEPMYAIQSTSPKGNYYIFADTWWAKASRDQAAAVRSVTGNEVRDVDSAAIKHMQAIVGTDKQRTIIE